MTMFQLTSNDIVEELRLVQTLNRASNEGKTVIHFQDLYADRMIFPSSNERRGGENNLKQ